MRQADRVMARGERDGCVGCWRYISCYIAAVARSSGANGGSAGVLEMYHIAAVARHTRANENAKVGIGHWGAFRNAALS